MNGMNIMKLEDLKIMLYADGANLTQIAGLAADSRIQGFTTNPTLMRSAGITDYKEFADRVLSIVPELPVSFEVFADNFNAMEKQAYKIAGWGKNVYVKIPIMNSLGDSTIPIIGRLSGFGVKVNVTAVMTYEQVREVTKALDTDTPSIISIFAGRIADTGADPMPVVLEAVYACRLYTKILWASPRELLNIVQAAQVGCHI